MEYGNIQFRFKIPTHPKVVVADKIVYRDSAVGQFSQFPQGTCKTTGNHVVVFKPEIEQIPQKEYGGGVLF